MAGKHQKKYYGVSRGSQEADWGWASTYPKIFKGVGSGVIEIALKYDKEAYRCIQAVQLGERIYILHAFQKKAKKGISTPKQDVDLIKQRYKEAKELEKKEKTREHWIWKQLR